MAGLTIDFYGGSAAKITVKQQVGEVALVTDPLSEGAKLPRGLASEIVVLSNPEERKKIHGEVAENPFVISHAGEYEVKGIFVYGFPVPDGKGADAKARPTIYRIETDDMTIAFLGPLKEPLSDALYDRLLEVDVLMLPVGGNGALDARQAAEAMTRIEPRVVIPMWYKTPGGTGAFDPIEKFVKESGLAPEKVERVRLAKKDLPQEETHLYVVGV